MAKGNRTINIYENDVWKNVFFDSVGTYVNVINQELSSNYKLEPLSNYIKIGGGYAFKTVEYKKSGVPIIRISDFNNEKIDISNCIYYNEHESLSKYELNEEDIIICLTGGTIAKLGIVQSGLGKLYMNQRVGRFDILDDSKFEKEYVYWIARSVQSIIKNLAWGAAIPNVSPKQIEKIQFSFPPIEVQKQIIEFLNDLKNNTLQDKTYFNISIENHIKELQNNNVSRKEINSELTHQLDLVKQLRQSFLREAMQGKLLAKAENTNITIPPAKAGGYLLDDNATFSENEINRNGFQPIPNDSNPIGFSQTGQQLLEKIKAEKAQLIAEKNPSSALRVKKEKPLAPITAEEIPFEIPEHWVWCRLGETLDLLTDYHANGGYEKLKENIELLDKEDFAIMLRTTNFHPNKYLAYKYITEKAYNFLGKSKVLAGDLIMNKIGDPGAVFFVDERGKPMSLAMNLFLLRLNKSISNFYIYSYLDMQKVYVKSFAKGSTSMTITKDAVKELLIPLPPLHEQEQIVTKLEELMGFCDGLEQSIKQSQEYNEMLLQEVLREALQPEEAIVY
ncbi:type I restriction enzyme S subunit [Flavobacterium sp. PL11]|uniref:restriction endonuclease subunit S n=1 Tax=Flavobacterium sp. PL11 TaxID=3071717 RepID=UPI002DFE73DA|nr:type I restriction enzyme S subunit [Flavobacterium sp. PL11]